MPKPLVIVESPAKAKTLKRFLGDKYNVQASVGHVRDLPGSAREIPAEIKDRSWGRMAVDVDGDFKPYYVVPAEKKKNVQALRAALKDASEVLLATDPDREGESISWHLTEVLRPKVPVRRIEFHEVTEDAVREAIEQARTVNDNLVRAQESRRILDRLYGYTVSPVLWKKVQTGLSAGRVQSVAVRLIVEREEARRAFRAAAYWDLEARLAGDGREFTATLVRIGEARVATGKDFDSATGALRSRTVRHLDETAARTLAADVAGRLPWRVSDIDERPGVERPAPPFTTSTLTQEASRKLGFSTDRTMQIAQRLFQGIELDTGEIEGLITYHRTDSTTLSEKALHESARVITQMFGPEYHAGPRRYATKVKNAQEAHEAIRPTDFRLAPQRLARVLDSDELRLYELVWKRTMASQMVDARVRKTTVDFSADTAGGERAVFAATGKTIEFAGFRRAYVEGSDDPAAELEEQETVLPACRVGDLVQPAAAGTPSTKDRIVFLGVDPKGHETQPPARYTEAALIKELEQGGIGRPSTYASIIKTIQGRGYVFRQGRALVPSFTAFAVTHLLRQHFSDYVDVGFTAEMEEVLDQISNGEQGWLDFIRRFYRGDGKHVGLEQVVKRSEEVDYPVIDLGTDPETSQTLRVRIGQYGPFVQRGEGGPGNTASLPDELPPADLSVERAIELLKAKAEGPRRLGVDPATGQAVYLLTGRFGAYVQLGETPDKADKKAPKPRRASLARAMTEDTVTLDEALQLLSLPRKIGQHPDDGEPIVANFGRFGPYVKHGDEFRSLERDDDVFTIGLDAAVDLLRQPKKSRRRPAAARTVLRELGPHPRSQAALRVLAGRYGPYVTDGTTNASLPKGTSPDAVTLPEAADLIDARAAAGPKAPRGRKPAPARKRARAPKAEAARA
jgi:DNA topoisomerase I